MLIERVKGGNEMEQTPRERLLLQMYDQMFNDINRHIMVVWQSVGVVVGAIAIFALVEKEVLPLDIAASLIVLLCSWLLAHLLDASYWYNRNLVIIANIERQFLAKGDLREIHYYFGAHRPKNRMIMHLKIQIYLGAGIGVLVLLYHFQSRVYSGLSSPLSKLEMMRSMPYLLCVAGGAGLAWLKGRKDQNYEEFIANSPGINVDADSVSFGTGHGFKKSDLQPEAPNAREGSSI